MFTNGKDTWFHFDFEFIQYEVCASCIEKIN